MSDHPLLLPSAKSGVLIPLHRSHPLRWVALALGTLAILVGGADMLMRASSSSGCSTSFSAFAPAAALFDPSLSSQAGC